MGWDADAEPIELEEIKNKSGKWKGLRIKNAKAHRVFEKAADDVIKEAGSVDGYLHIGGLDCSTCGEMLERMTGHSVYDEKGWPAGLVQELCENAKGLKVKKSELWAYLSAKRFLECCARLSLGVRFSW